MVFWMVFQWEMFNVGESDRGFIHGAGAICFVLSHRNKNIKRIECWKKQKAYPTPPLSHSPIPPPPLLNKQRPPPIPSHPTTQANPPPPQHPTPPPPKQTLNKLTRPVPKNQKHGQNKKGTQSPPPPIRRGKRKRHETIKLGYSR